MRVVAAMLAVCCVWAQDGTVTKASIGGTVVNAVTGAPVNKAAVQLWSMDGHGASENAVTDAGGSFTFPDLAPGLYRIQAQHAGFPVSSYERPGQSSVGLTLGAGEEKPDVRIALTPGATASGRVVDEDGEPLEGATVSLMQYRLEHGKRVLSRGVASSTNDEGEYRLHGAIPGRYYIRAESGAMIPTPRPLLPLDAVPPGPRESYGSVFYPGARDISGATRLTLAPGVESKGVDFRLPAILVVSVRGKLIGPTEAFRLQNSAVNLIPSGGKTTNDDDAQTTSLQRADGTFNFERVVPGAYRLVARVFGQGKMYWATQEMVAGNAPIDGLNVALQPGLDISGSVEMEEDSGDPAEQLKQVRIQLLNDTGRMYAGPSPPWAEVQSDGRFVLRSVVPAVWQFNVQVPAGMYVKSVRLGDQEIPGDELPVAPGSAGKLQIVLGTKTGSIEGRVQGRADSGDEGVSVIGKLAEGPGRVNYFYGVDPQGRFRMDNVIPGRYCLIAMETESAQMVQQVDVFQVLKNHCETVNVEEGATASVTLTVTPRDAIERAIGENE